MEAATSQLTEVIRVFLESLNITPLSYASLFSTNIDVNDIQKLADEGVFPVLTGLAPAFTYAIVLSLARYVLQIILFKPLAMKLMRVRDVPVTINARINQRFANAANKSPKKSEIEAFVKEENNSSLTTYEVGKYLWAKRRAKSVERKLVKFYEASWRCIFYSAFCVLGYYTLFLPEPQIWITNTANFFQGWPLDHRVSDAVQFYYVVQLGAYMHQLMYTEVNRSDAIEMILHHCVTIMLIVGSYLTNFTRIGSYILLLHDVADVFLEVAKVLNYVSTPKPHQWMKNFLVDPIFALFAITFFVSRLVLFPYYVLRGIFCSITSLGDAVTMMLPESVGRLMQCYDDQMNIFKCNFVGCYYYIGLLSTLQVLHIFWFYLIARMVYRLALAGNAGNDIRESDDEDMEDVTYDPERESKAVFKEYEKQKALAGATPSKERKKD